MTALAVLLVLGTSWTEQLSEAEKQYRALEYDRALLTVQRLTRLADVPREVMVPALALEGTLLAITKDVTDAEQPFRRLLRLEPGFELPPKSAPRIVAAFRKVQADERALAADAERNRRQTLLSKLRLLDPLPERAVGGKPLEFRLRLYDPDGVVSKVSIPYRRAGDGAFSVLALQRDELGAFAGSLPADFTASPDGFTLQYFWQSYDSGSSPLLGAGSEQAPLLLHVAAGQRPRPLHRAVFFTSLASSVLSGAAFVALRVSLADTEAHTRTVFSQGIDSVRAVELKRQGDALASWTNAAAVTASVLLVTALVVAWLTDWSGS